MQAFSKKACTQNIADAAPKFNTGVLEKDTVNFSQSVKKALYPFTDSTTQVPKHHKINGYNSNIRYALNRLEKGQPLDEEDKWALNVAEKLDESFQKLPLLEDDFVFYRGRSEHPVIKRFNEDFHIIEAANTGDIVVPDKAYSYGAFKKEIAEHWSGGLDKNMMFEIHVPKGVKISRNMEHGGEVVFPKGAEYRLISKEKDSRGVLNVVLEYILPKN